MLQEISQFKFINKIKVCKWDLLNFETKLKYMAKSILNDKSLKFLESYLNNPSPTGYEWEGQ